MRQDSVQHRTGRSFGKGTPAHRSASRRPRAGRRPVTRGRRAAIAASRKRRRPLFFYAVTAAVAGELAIGQARVISDDGMKVVVSDRIGLHGVGLGAVADNRVAGPTEARVALDVHAGPTEQLDDELAERHGPHAPGPEQDLGLSPELAAALATLPQRDREIVALRFGGDLTGPEIAELLDLTLANVQQILSRSLRKLRAELEPTPD